jgi:hypothetical protein
MMNKPELKKEIAEAVSLSYHPLLLPLYALAFLYILPIFEVKSLGYSFLFIMLGFLVFTSFLVPLIGFALFKRMGYIQSFKMEKAEERSWPYFLMFLIYSINFWLWKEIEAIPLVMSLGVMVPALVALTLLMVNLFIKVSAHAASATAVLAYFGVIAYFYNLSFSLPLAVMGLMALSSIGSRLYLKQHSIIELALGVLIGLLVGAVGSFLVLYNRFQ